MKMNNYFILTIMLVWMPFFSCQGESDAELTDISRRQAVANQVRGLIGRSFGREYEKRKFQVFADLGKFKNFYSGLKKKIDEWPNNNNQVFRDVLNQVFRDVLFLDVAASEVGRREIILFMLDEGADVNAYDKNGKTALHLLMMKESDSSSDKKAKKVFSSILLLVTHDKIKFGQEDERGNTSLHDAAERGRSRAVDLIIGQLKRDKANGKKIINEKNDDGRSAFMLAVNNGYEDIVEALAKWGADVNLRDKDGTSALHIAVENNSEKMVGLLLTLSLKEGMPVLILPDEKGNTPIHKAADTKHVSDHAVEIVGMLLDGRAKWMEKVPDKRAALEVLVNHKNDDGKNPLDLAVSLRKSLSRWASKQRENMKDIIFILKSKGAKQSKRR